MRLWAASRLPPIGLGKEMTSTSVAHTRKITAGRRLSWRLIVGPETCQLIIVDKKCRLAIELIDSVLEEDRAFDGQLDFGF
jgi:hypothetical protein